MKQKINIAQRMWNIHLIDTEIERGFCAMKSFFKLGGDYFYSLKLKKEDIKNDF